MKKIICLLLSLVLIFGLAVPCLAAEKVDADYEGYPLVIVRGINYMGLYNEDGSPAISVSFSDIAEYAKDYITEIFINKNEDAFIDSSLGLVDKIFSPVANDNSGSSINTLYYDKYDSSMAEYKNEVELFENTGETGIVKAAVDKIGYENVYFFTYDWRKSAKDLASDLSTMIETAVSETGMDKVNLAAVSMGGMVSTAYLYYYGSSRVNSLTYISSAHNGTYSCGDCFNGNIYFDGNVIYHQLKKITKDNIIMDVFIEILRKIGLFDAASAVVNKFVENNSDVLNCDVLRKNFGTLLGLWALCPDDIFDSSVEFIFGGYEDEYPELMAQLAETRKFIFATETTIDSAIESGVNVSFTSNYGLPLRPYFKNSNQQGDNVIETYFTSNFAVTSKLGETLSQEQISNADPEYLSPDKTVDASTALYKERTWFIKGAPHVSAEYGSEFAEFVLWLALCEEQPTVLTNEKYPQFMLLDSEKRLVADK